MAWNMGYKILMYSGEMSTAMVGFRFDTLNKHFLVTWGSLMDLVLWERNQIQTEQSTYRRIMRST